MKQIKLNDKVGLDLQKLIAGKMLLQAGSGGGKSYAIRRILEQSFGEIPHLILDTEGEFSSLREKYDYILIGKEFDITADPKTAALLALRLWEERVSAIVDLYELSPWDRQLFVKNFVDALINAPKKLWKPVLLVIDEAHEYAPESDKSDSGRALHLLASKGRKRQIGAIFATQRISSLSKNIVASCKNKLIGYASETNDVKRAAFELGFTPAEARGLRDLDPGEFYAFGPALTKEVTKIKIGSVKTKHEETATGGLGTVAKASPKVKAALARLADLPQAAAEEARTVAELKAEIVRMKREANRPVVDLDLVEKVKAQGALELKNIKKHLYQILLRSHGNVESSLKKLQSDLHSFKAILDNDPAFKPQSDGVALYSKAHTEDDWKRIGKGLPNLIKKLNGGMMVIDEVGEITPEMEKKFYFKSPAQSPVVIQGQQIENSLAAMGTGERQVLIAIAQQPDGMTREHITVQTGYKRSTRDAYIQKLKQKLYIKVHGMGLIAVTHAGIEALGNDYEPLPIGPYLLQYHLNKLPEGEAKILRLLAEHGPHEREEIGSRLSFKRSTRDAYIQRLATRQLVVVEGQTIRISEHLQ